MLHGMLILLMSMPCLVAFAATPPASAPVDPSRAGDVSLSHADPVIDARLDAIERGAADLDAFTAKLQYETVDAILDRRTRRIGTMVYEHGTSERPRRFAFLLDRRLIERRSGEFRIEERPQHYIFDGRRLAEINHDDRQYIERELVPPGKSFDALELGNGPFPLPVGQKKQDVLERFDVTDAVLPDDGPLSFFTTADGVMIEGIRLVPKPNLEASKDVRHIDIFFDTGTWLPVGVHVVEVNDDEKIVTLRDVKRNPEKDGAFNEALRIRRPDPSTWMIDIRPYAD